MNSMFTALTRPRIASGVRICTRAKRITTLTTSAAPSTASAASDSGSERDTANTAVASPNTITAPNMIRPAWRRSGRRASSTDMPSAPTAGAARRMPRPQDPVCRMSRA